MPHSSRDVSIEVLFAQRLASNQTKIRHQHVKKLAKFLGAKAAAAQAGRGSGLTQDEMLKLWKGIFYCFWMADKPLVQEDLAEKISSLVHVLRVADDELAFLPFVRCGLVTLGRDWFGLDRWRMDKFMMFVRRFLRHTFSFSKQREWKNVEGLVKVFEEFVFAQTPTSSPCLGFQLHFTDVYLEELAKVGGGEDGDGSLEDESIRKLLRPFVTELKQGKAERLRSHVEERVFRHLMRQSDVGIAHEQVESDEEEGEEEESEDKTNDAEALESDEGDDADGNVPQDPRAGRVDVTIPQLMLNYGRLGEELLEAGGERKVGQAQRKVLYKLAKQFRSLHEGHYPLSGGLGDDDDNDEEVPKVNVKKARKRRAEEALLEVGVAREEKKKYKMAMVAKRKKAKAEPPQQQEVEEEEAPDSGVDGDRSEEEKENDGNKNSVEYEKVKGPIPRTTRIKPANAQEENAASSPATVKEDKHKKKKRRKRKTHATDKEEAKSNQKSEEEVLPKRDGDEEDASAQSAAKKQTKKGGTTTGAAGDTATQEKEIPNEKRLSEGKGRNSGQSQDDFTVKKVKKVKKIRQKQSAAKIDKGDSLPTTSLPGGFDPPKIRSMGKAPTPIFIRKATWKVAKTNKLGETLKKTSGGQQEQKKRINFAGNKYQSLLEHSMSVQESPDIPFMPERKPKQGVLKNKQDISVVHTPSPLLGIKEVKKNTKINGKSKQGVKMMRMRMTAADFF